MQPHQQRVVDEKTELDTKHLALSKFFSTDIYKNLDIDEQDRLCRQYDIMEEYSDILAERIEAFN